MTELLSNDQLFIRKLTNIILENLTDENFGVKMLVQESGISLYNLSRRLRSINNKKINQFIREVRLQKARELLLNDAFSVSEVAYQVGFISPAYFNTCFHEFFGYTPGEVKKRSLERPEQNQGTSVISNQEQKRTLQRVLILKLFLPIGVLFIIFAIIVFPNIFKIDTLHRLTLSGERTSVVVLPFQNMTKDTIWDLWQTGIQQSLISTLSYIGELKVKQQEYINTQLKPRGFADAGISSALAGTISNKLDADIYISGSIQSAGPSIRVDAQLIDTKTKEVLKSFSVEKPSGEENIFLIIDTLSVRLKNFLLISKLIKENPEYGRFPLTTNSPEAFRYSLYGAEAKNTAISKDGYYRAIDWYLKALAIDSNYYDPMDGLSFAYANLGMMEQSLQWVIKAYKKKDQWPIIQQLGASVEYASYFESSDEKIKYLNQFQQIDDQTPGVCYVLGITYNSIKQYDKSIPELEKAIRIYHKWGVDDSWYYSDLGYAYHKTGQYRKEKKLYRKAEKYILDDPWLITRQVILSMTLKDFAAANNNIVKLESVLNTNSYTETEIKEWLAGIYTEAGNLDKAEEYYRKALELEPENPRLLSNFATFIFENNRNLNEFTGTIDKALALSENKIDYYNFLDIKGYGFYRYGKYQEALDILQKTWDSAPFKLYYIKSHLEEVKKAVAEQK